MTTTEKIYIPDNAKIVALFFVFQPAKAAFHTTKAAF